MTENNMIIRVGDRIYQIPDSCGTEGPKVPTLKRHLGQHGAESFVSSRKYGQFAPCIIEELKEAGAEVVPIEEDLSVQSSEPEPAAPAETDQIPDS